MSVAVAASKPRANQPNQLSPRPLRPADFFGMSQQQLDDLFRASPTGAILKGVTQGTAIVMPVRGSRRSRVSSRAGSAGRARCSTPTEQHPSTGSVRSASRRSKRRCRTTPVGSTGHARSSFDYSKTSFVAQKIRDEIREVTPGVYLGKVWWGRKRILDFALEVDHPVTITQDAVTIRAPIAPNAESRWTRRSRASRRTSRRTRSCHSGSFPECTSRDS